MTECGSTGGYQRHSDLREPHCQPCKDAKAAWTRGYRIQTYLVGGKLHVDATGTRRRLQALARMGWSYSHLAPMFGVSHQAVSSWTKTATVHRSTRLRVCAVYDELWDVPGPSAKSRRLGELYGWAPPLAFDDDNIDDPRAQANWGLGSVRQRKPVDDIAVTRAMHGDAVRLTPDERTEAVRRLRARGLTSARIAELLHIERRSVERIKRRAS